MSKFRAIRHFRNGPIFDTRWGTDSPATIIANGGWLTFGLNSGNRRLWLDATNGNDANNGLTAATAMKTWNAIWSSFIGGSPGDQLMVAGTGGRTYSDSTNSSITPIASLTPAPTYPSAILSYDPAAPADATRYGRLVGPDMPVVVLDNTTGTSLCVFNIEGRGYCAFQGLEVKSNVVLAYQTPGISWATNNHPGLIIQNCRFNGTGISLNPATNANTAATNTQNAGLISKSSMWNSFGFFGESLDGFYIQDFVTVHNGWNIGACREDTIPNGGAQVFTHNFYYHASCTNGRFDRVVTIDSSLEGIGVRGDIAGATQIVSIDNVVGLGPGGFSAVYTEAPNGVNQKWDDVTIMGADNCTPTNPGGWAVEWQNSLPGSYMRNVAVFDSTLIGNGFDRYAAGTNKSSLQIPQYLLCDKWSTWNYASIEQTSIGADDTLIHLSWSNSTLDMLPLGHLGTVTNCFSRSVAPVGYKTRPQTYAAMGFASKAAMINAMVYRPDLPWAQAINSISLPAMGLTPSYALIAPPSVASPPAVYPVSLGALTLGTSSFAHAASSTTMVGGTSGNPFLSSSDLPAGFTLSGRLLSYDGTGAAGTPTFHITETSKDTLGSHTTALTLSIS